jgi:hypothetical protein
MRPARKELLPQAAKFLSVWCRHCGRWAPKKQRVSRLFLVVMPRDDSARELLARRDEREYREYLNEDERSETGCSAGRTGSPARQPRWGPRMQLEFHHGLLRGVTRGRSVQPLNKRLLP